MKIRTDYVTNSSSASYGEVVIDNPVLLEILAKYKAMGTFGESVNFNIGDFESDGWGESESDPDINTLTPAFHSSSEAANGSRHNTPSSLDKVLEKIIKVLDDEFYNYHDIDGELYQKLQKELKQREEDIFKAFITVKWFLRQELYSGRFGVREFKYDKESGESYYTEETGCLDW